MTREEFHNTITDFASLYELCCSMSRCYIMEGIYDQSGLDDYINDQIEYWARDQSWDELRDQLNDIPTGYDWYRVDDYGDIFSVEDEFMEYKSEVEEWMEDNDYFDEDDDDDYEEPERPSYVPVPEDYVPVAAEDVSFDDVLEGSCLLKTVKKTTAPYEAEKDSDIVNLFSF